jgi:hypothetical protein
MQLIKLGLFGCFSIVFSAAAMGQEKTKAPAFVLGSFQDDYGINYAISDTLWFQKESVKYHILEWNQQEQWVLAKNDLLNPSEPGKYTRIDYRQFEKMEPYKWGFCYTVYDADTKEKALKALSADRANPKKGCNGFPFSRLKPL